MEGKQNSGELEKYIMQNNSSSRDTLAHQPLSQYQIIMDRFAMAIIRIYRYVCTYIHTGGNENSKIYNLNFMFLQSLGK